MSIADWSTTAASNTTLEGVSWAEGMEPGDVNNGVRAIAAAVRAGVGNKGTDISSASSIDLGAATGQFVDVTGTTTITALGTVAAGTWRIVRFTGALTLTHNATSLILPGSANITTVANDRAAFLSLGSGNWICAFYQRAAGVAASSTGDTFTGNVEIKSTSAGTSGPQFTLTHDSASPAANDTIGTIFWNGKDSAGNATSFVRFRAILDDPTDTSEDTTLVISVMDDGTLTNQLSIGGGVLVGAATGGVQGVGTINATAVYDDGSLLCAPIEEKLTGRYDKAMWRALAPNGGVEEYEAMKTAGFVPGSAESFVAELEKRQGVPGYWNKAEWRERTKDGRRVSFAEREERMLLALDAMALTIRDLTQRVKALES